jgi:hypothetical protein
LVYLKIVVMEIGIGRRSSGDYFYLFSPHPTPYTF